MTIYEALNAVKADLGAIKKGDTMKGGSFSYKYRSIDDVLNALHPILVKHGVVGPIPSVVEHKRDGKKTVIISDFTWAHTDGSSVTGRTVGEGDDPGDKGANKASTGALKTFLTQSLAIPFDTDDPDHYPSQTDTKPAQKPAAKAETPKAAPASSSAQGSSNEILCAECGYSVGSGPIKRKQGKTFHKECADGKPAAPQDANDITSLIDNFPGAE